MAQNYRLKQARELRGWSQAKVAELIGTDATTVSRWERGIFFPTPYFREKLCVLFEKNAEELGLLETSQPSQQPEHTTGAARTSGAEPQKVSPPPDDVFAYILESASQDHQAYLLWEYAYVQALRGQYDEAQQLGEASLNVFEQSGHPNAAAIRAWLLQHDLLSPHPPSTGDLAHDTPQRPRPPQEKPTKSRFPWGGVGVLLAILIVATAAFSGFSFYQSRFSPAPRVSLEASQQHQTTSYTSLSEFSATPTIQPTAAFTPTPSPTQAVATPTPIATQAAAAPSTTLAVLTPSQLTSHLCQPDSQTFRCTLTLSVSGSAQEVFAWRASSRGIIAQINPTSGQITAGQPYQIIVYINQASTQHGSLDFSLHAPASGEIASASASWQY
jgi:transcriptional regulator with XRE-family HTH domain